MMGNWQHCHHTLTGIIFGDQDDGAGPVLDAFLKPAGMVAGPEITVSDDEPGNRVGERHVVLLQFVVERLGGVWSASRLHGGDVCIREIIKGEHLPVAPFEAAVFLDGDHHRAFAAVARYSNRLCEGEVLIAANVPLELGGGYLNHLAGSVVHSLHQMHIPHDLCNPRDAPVTPRVIKELSRCGGIKRPVIG